MKTYLSILFLAILSYVKAGDNQTIVMKPLESKSELEEALFVFIQGANVSTKYYLDPMTQVQAESNLKLTVVMPAFLSATCITACSSTSLCSPMNKVIQDAIKMAVDDGYTGPTDSFFLAGHSLGGVCAATYTKAYKKQAYVKANILYGAYVTDQNVKDWEVPVATIGAELDGGLGRPGNLLNSIMSSDEAAVNQGDGVYSDWQILNKPVFILPNMDHSDFCPGFQVPGDVYPSDIEDKTKSNELIGTHTAAFLHLHTTQDSKVTEEASVYLMTQAQQTRENLMLPYTDALKLEGSVDGEKAPWCELVQPELVGLKNEDDKKRLSVISIYKEESHPFEDTRVSYNTTEDFSVSTFNVSGHNQYYGTGVLGINTSCLKPAHELGCKMASADRVAEQLQIDAGNYDNSLTCEDMNKLAYQKAIELLNQTEAGKFSITRFEARGRPICFSKDKTATGNIGPLWVKETMTIKDDKKNNCLEVASLVEGPTGLSSWLFPGIHYCKLISPARIIDYIMIDSLKATSGCLNKKSSESPELFLE